MDGGEGWKRRVEEKMEVKDGREWWKRRVEVKNGREEWKRRGEEEDTMGKGGMTAMRGSMKRRRQANKGGMRVEELM